MIKEALLIAVTAVICLCLARWLQLPQGYWAVISSIIVMQSNVGATVDVSRNRLIGTAIGAVTGGIFSLFFGSHIWSFGTAVMMAVLLCTSLQLKESYRLAATTVVIIMLASHAESSLFAAILRFFEVSLGIIVALGVSFLIHIFEKK